MVQGMDITTPPERQTFMLLHELHKQLRHFQEAQLGGSELTLTQYAILDAIAQREPLPLSQLHRHLEVEKSTTTRLLAPLIRRQWVERQRNPADGRVVLLSLSEAGREGYRRAAETMHAAMGALNQEIPVGERVTVQRALRQFIQALRTRTLG